MNRKLGPSGDSKVKHVNVQQHLGEFNPLMDSSAVQAAVMVLKPGNSSTEKIEDEHPRAEQWVFVISGTGVARLARRQIRLTAGVLLLIPKNMPHQITNTGRVRLVTLNFYSPPAYTQSGNVRPSISR